MATKDPYSVTKTNAGTYLNNIKTGTGGVEATKVMTDSDSETEKSRMRRQTLKAITAGTDANNTPGVDDGSNDAPFLKHTSN